MDSNKEMSQSLSCIEPIMKSEIDAAIINKVEAIEGKKQLHQEI